MGEPHVPEQRDYEVRRGKPPVHRRFKKGQSGNPRLKNWPALLVGALDEPVVLTIEGAPRDHQARGGRHSAGNKSTSHSRPRKFTASYPAPGGRTSARKIGCDPLSSRRRPGSIPAMGIGPSPV